MNFVDIKENLKKKLATFLVTRLRKAIKKRLSFGHCPKEALAPPPPLILDIREVTFVSADFVQPLGNFCIGPKLKYLPKI